MQPVGEHSSLLLLAFGADARSSLMMSYAREQNLQYLEVKAESPIGQVAEHIKKNVRGRRLIVDGLAADVKALIELQVQLHPEKLLVVYFNRTDHPTDGEQQVISYYERHAKLRRIDLSVNVDESYRNLRRGLLQRVIFIYGPPLEIKSQLAKQIASATGYEYVNYQQLRSQTLNESDGIVFVNKFIRWCIQNGKNVVLDGFIERKGELAVLEEYLLPRKVIHIKPTKDQVESQLKAIEQVESRKAKLKEFEEYIKLEKELVDMLAKRSYYLSVTPESTDQATIQKVVKLLQPTTVYLNTSNQEFVKNFTEKFKAIHLNPLQLMKSQFERQTITAQQYLLNSPSLPFDALMHYLKNVIYNLDCNIVLSGLPENVSAFQFFEHHVVPIVKYVVANAQYSPAYSQQPTPEMFFLQQQKLIVLEGASPNPNYLLSLLKAQPQFVIVNGPQAAGKTSISKVIAKQYGYRHIEFEPYVASIKEKLIAAEDGEQLPARKVIQHFKELAKKEKILVDWLPYEGKDLESFISEVEAPLIINIKVDTKNLIRRYRKKAETDVNADVTEEDTQRTEAAIEKNNNWVRSTEQILERHPHLRLFQLDFNGSLLSSESLLPIILKPRVFLIGKRQHNLLYLNIALKYRFDYIDLHNSSLRSIKDQVSKCNQRDIVLANYSSGQNLISDDINWIQSNVGIVRYVCVWNEQAKHMPQNKIKLERPVVQVKKKVVNEEGEEVPQDPPAEQEDGQPKKPKLDIYAFEWTEIGTARNLSQWFLSYRLPNTELSNQASNLSGVYSQFERVLKDLNNNKDLGYYQLIK